MNAKEATSLADLIRFSIFATLDHDPSVSGDEAGAIASACESVIRESLIEMSQSPNVSPRKAVIRALDLTARFVQAQQWHGE